MVNLQEAGLTVSQEKVYVALIELGPSMAGQISRKTGLHRRNVYDTTELLIKKGLVGYILRNNRRIFHAVTPRKIIDNIKQTELLLEPLIKDLEKKYSNISEKEETSFYKGKEGLKAVFEDQLQSKEILILGASPRAYDILKFYFNWYDKTRKSKKIWVKIIANDRKIKRVPLADIRYLPEKYGDHVATNIYRDKIAIILWAQNPIAIVIKNKEISDSYRRYFELMWKMARE